MSTEINIGTRRKRPRDRSIAANTPTAREELKPQFWETIALGKIPLATRFSELEIGEAFGYPARAPIIRELLQVFVHDGLLSVTPQVGYHVPLVSHQEAFTIFKLRGKVESFATSSLADHTDPLQALLLQEHARGMREALLTENQSEFILMQERFHEHIPLALAVPEASNTIQLWARKITVFNIKNPFTTQDMERLVSQSTELAEKIKSKDWKEASEVIEQSIIDHPSNLISDVPGVSDFTDLSIQKIYREEFSRQMVEIADAEGLNLDDPATRKVLETIALSRAKRIVNS